MLNVNVAKAIYASQENKKVDPTKNSSQLDQKVNQSAFRIVNQQQQNTPMANAGGIYTKIFNWEIDNLLTLPQDNGEYLQSEIFTSNGPYGQQGVKWALRLFPRGERGKSKNNVSILLVLLDGNGSNYVKVDWKLAVINAKGNKVNEHEEKSLLFDAKNDNTHGFDNFISRSRLANANNNLIVEGHKLILHSQIFVKIEKDLQAELMQKTEQTKNLKRKLDSKEEEVQKLRSDYEQYQKSSRAINEKLELAAIEKYKKDEEERASYVRSVYELQLKRYREQIEKLEKEKLAAVEKCGKEEEARSLVHANFERYQKLYRDGQKNHQIYTAKLEYNNLAALEKCRKEMEERKKLQLKYDKLYNYYVRDSSKLMEEIENEESKGSSAINENMMESANN